MRRRNYGSLLAKIYAFFLKHGNYYSYQILYATSNSCKLSFHILTKKFINGKILKVGRKKYSIKKISH